ncbi:MAG: endolytic transglycosylase MltG [Bacilli bacterium]|nr:endolytic transglycosylase MltG [Bacilli bacterium]
MRFFRNTMVCLIIFFIVAILSFCGFYYYGISPVGNSDKKITVDIPYGSSRDEIASILKDEDLIRNATIFTLYLKLNGIETLQAGTYSFTKNMNLETIVDKIVNGEILGASTTMTFKEGKTISDLATLIASKTDYTEEEFIALAANKEYLTELIKDYWFLTNDILDDGLYFPLEGYLFPDTYDIYNLTLKQIIEIQLDNTKKVLDDYKTEIEASKYNIHQIMTMASMVELEGNNDSNRAGIARVFYNRLDDGISLGSDVTAHYGVQKSMSEEITQAELDADNPYNTRNTSFAGLPLGPISNPSESSIEAALNPTDSNYNYFMADKNGKIYFSKTLAEQTAKIKELKEQGLWFTYD